MFLDIQQRNSDYPTNCSGKLSFSLNRSPLEVHHLEKSFGNMLDSVAAQMLLLKCVGDEIWSEKTCREAGVPDQWIEELCENYESGFDSDRNTIYGEDGAMTNQYRGVSDLLLARKLAQFIGLDWQSASALAYDRRREVTAIQDLLDEF